MSRNLAFILFFLTISGMGLRAQWSEPFQVGYSKTLRGGGFQYHSPEPEVKTSMLLRSVDSLQYIEWETAPVKRTGASKELRFIWMYGIDANPDAHEFRLFFNDRYLLSFFNPVLSSKTEEKVRGEQGVFLTFLPTLLDKFNDPMGYAILTVPASMIREGMSQRIKIVGESAGSRSWYMTFESEVAEKFGYVQQEALIRSGDQQLIPVVFTMTWLGDPVHASLEIPGRKRESFTLKPGYNEVRVLMPAVTEPVNMEATVKIGELAVRRISFSMHPVRPWRIFLVQHTHTDIGYTRPQTEILPEHLRYIDYALDFCDQTDSMPDDARFRWTCETSWAVREYLLTRPEQQIRRLKRRIAEGRIEPCAMFLNGSDLSDEATLAAMLQPVKRFREQGLTVKAAMQNDINGVPWGLTDLLPQAGIQSLTMAQNTHRARKPFKIPTVFWWESPSGSRLLVNRPEHYMFGNSLGILTNTETFGTNLFRHLQEISSKGYPLDIYAIQFSGYLTDNSPPSTTACRVVKEWNEKYIWPRLRLATVSEFPSLVRKNFASGLPVIRGAWPDWWMDGFGSAAIETAWARKAHANQLANNGLMSMALLMGDTLTPGIRVLHDRITDDLAFYDEHTFGAAESIWDPLAENSVVQLGQKVSFVWDAVKTSYLLREEVMGRIQDHFPRAAVPSVTVVNTLTTGRSGLVDLYIDHEILPRDRTFRIEGPDSSVISAQARFSREDGTWWTLWLPYVPGFGFCSYRIIPAAEPAAPISRQTFTGSMENRWYRIGWDTARGRISGLLDKELGIGLMDTSFLYGTGEFIYETLGKNRAQLEQFTLVEVDRKSPAKMAVASYISGPVWQSLTISGQIPGCASEDGIVCEIRLYHHEKLIEFRYSMKKLPVTDPEGGYVVFPFRLDGGKVYYEVAGGTVEAGIQEIPGASSDWQGIQNFVSVRNETAQILFSSPEIPLVHLFDINLGRFSEVPVRTLTPELPAPYVYSWVFNNYWTTNFLASQEGELNWSYRITSTADTSLAAAARFGWFNRVPMLTRIFPAGKPVNIPPMSILGATPFNLMPVDIKPSGDGKGVVLHLRETAGIPARLPVDDPLSSLSPLLSGWLLKEGGKPYVSEVNVLQEEIAPVYQSLQFKPFETRFLKIHLKN